MMTGMSDGGSTDTARTFGGWLRQKRIAAGFRSATQAAKRAGVTSATWASWERDAFNPNPRNAPIIARALRVDQRDVLLAAGFEPAAYLDDVGDGTNEIAALIAQLPTAERNLVVDLAKTLARLTADHANCTGDDMPHTVTHLHVPPGPAVTTDHQEGHSPGGGR